jgi:hypothetical protein
MTMKREVIERLAIDSAAGELNEDIQALFDAYLIEHPQAGQWAEDIAGVYKETATVIDAKTSAAVAGSAMPCIKAQPLLRAKWWSFGRAAAALIVGALIGFAGGRWPINGETSRIVRAGGGGFDCRRSYRFCGGALANKRRNEQDCFYKT